MKEFTFTLGLCKSFCRFSDKRKSRVFRSFVEEISLSFVETFAADGWREVNKFNWK